MLDHYVAEGIQELDGSKLSQLVTLRYGSVSDGVLDLGATPRSGNSSPDSRSFCINRLLEAGAGAIAELERNLIIERVRAGMRRARLEGRHIGQRPLEIDRVAILRDRNRGDSLTNIAKTHRVSRATVSRLLKQAKDAEPVSI